MRQQHGAPAAPTALTCQLPCAARMACPAESAIPHAWAAPGARAVRPTHENVCLHGAGCIGRRLRRRSSVLARAKPARDPAVDQRPRELGKTEAMVSMARRSVVLSRPSWWLRGGVRRQVRRGYAPQTSRERGRDRACRMSSSPAPRAPPRRGPRKGHAPRGSHAKPGNPRCRTAWTGMQSAASDGVDAGTVGLTLPRR